MGLAAEAVRVHSVGRAVVAPDRPNLREILRHGHNALLFDPADPQSFAAALTELTTDPGLRQRLGSSAAATSRTRELTWDGNVGKILGALSRGRPGGNCSRSP